MWLHARRRRRRRCTARPRPGSVRRSKKLEENEGIDVLPTTKNPAPSTSNPSAPSMSPSLLPTTSGGAHVCPSTSRPRRRRCFQVRAAASVPRPPPSSGSVGRRAVSLAGAAAAGLATAGGRADAASPLDKYIKRKKLEPLETYVPAVLLTRDQFVGLGSCLPSQSDKMRKLNELLHKSDNRICADCSTPDPK